MQRSLKNLLAISVILVLVVTTRAFGDDAVVVEHHASTESTHYYDADHIPAEMPPPTPQEAGVTVSEFSCTAFVTGAVLSQSQQGNLTQATVRVDGVRLVLNLKITEWILNTAPPKILAHENGHRTISDQFYSAGDDIARNVGNALIGQTFTATGKDVDAASSAALTAAADGAAKEYMGRVRNPSQLVQEIYDRITAHGTNDVKEADAIVMANREATRMAKHDDAQADGQDSKQGPPQ